MHFGSEVALVGAIDRDGFADLAIGSDPAAAGSGRVELASGRTGKLPA